MNQVSYVILAKVASIFNGKTPSKVDKRSCGHPVLKIKDVSENGCFRGRFESFVDHSYANKYRNKKVIAGDILILNAAHNADYVGTKIYLAEKDTSGALATGEWLIIRAHKNSLNPKYIYYWLLNGHTRNKIRHLVKGIHLYPKDMARLNVPLPPLEEQKRIAAILDKADAVRRKRQESIRLTEEFLKSVFLDMFGDPVTNPKGWPTEALSDVVSHAKHSLKRGPFGGSLKKEIFVSNGYKVYEQKHAIQNDFSIGTYYINEQKFHDMRFFEIRPGNLIISCSGTVGRIAIVPESVQPGIINQALLKISPDHEKISSLFLKYLLETESVQRELFGFSRGSGIKNFPPMSEVKRLQILLPDRNVITEFHHLHRIHSVFLSKYNLSLGLTDNLFNTLVQSSFKGNPK